MTATVDELRALVASRWEGLAQPSWPDPHPGVLAPRDEEYSRLTAPGRYRIASARARVWAQVLVDTLGARSEDLGPLRADGERPAVDRAVRVRPARSGVPGLLLLERVVRRAPDVDALPVLEIALGAPAALIECVPVCGCDACDGGSDALLDDVDRTIAAVVGGPFVVLRAPHWSIRWHPGGSSASSDGRAPDASILTGWCRDLADGAPVVLPSGVEAVVSRPWIAPDDGA